MNDAVERIESIKVGTYGGIAAAIAHTAIGAISDKFGFWAIDRLSLVSIAIAAASGCLFGIAYRYIIRSDRNDHLNSGAVLAFGLVRGLAQVDSSALTIAQTIANIAVVGASLLLITIVRYAIDYALWVGWISPMMGNTDRSNFTAQE
jgi:hypothetical protein